MFKLNNCNQFNYLKMNIELVKGSSITLKECKDIVNSNVFCSFFYSLRLLFSKKIWINKDKVKHSISNFNNIDLKLSAVFVNEFNYLKKDKNYAFNLSKLFFNSVNAVGCKENEKDEEVKFFLAKIPESFYEKILKEGEKRNAIETIKKFSPHERITKYFGLGVEG